MDATPDFQPQVHAGGSLPLYGPADAATLGIVSGQAVQVVSRVEALDARAVVSEVIRSGVVVLEQGWGSRLFDPSGREPSERYGMNRNSLVPNDELDPLSSVPSLNGTYVRLETMAATPACASPGGAGEGEGRGA